VKPFEIVPHTSEVALEVHGRDLSALFTNAALGLLALFDKQGKVRPTETISVRVRSSSAESLLVHWLSELVYIVQTKRWLYAKIEFARLQDTSLTATLHGEPIKEGVHSIAREVKAVTFHKLAITRDRDALRGYVILDV
jgi:SHS2 domain-containing protein